MSLARPPDRVSFNFADRCNMKCSYCYIPFDKERSDLATWRRIVDRFNEWGVKGVTFGGGDPFLYSSFCDLLAYASRTDLFIHVDTNGLGIKARELQFIKETVDLLGLPVDGSTSKIHGEMRGNERHFDIVTSLVGKINGDTSIKINTMVGKLNADDLPAMAMLLRGWRIAMWSLYQFWPVSETAIRNEKRFGISNEAFVKCAGEVIRMNLPFAVETASVATRHNSYFFVTGAGRCYTLDCQDSSKYIELGSIFDDEVLVRWHLMANSAANKARLVRDFAAAAK